MQGRPDIPRFSVVIKRDADRRHKRWAWEIRRTPELGIKLYGGDFISPQAAKLAGQEALQDLLKSLSQDEADGRPC
jgi:hypothetical protein